VRAACSSFHARSFDCISLVFHSALTSIRQTSMAAAIRLKAALLHKPLRRPSSSHASAMSSVEREEDDDSRGVKLVTCASRDTLHTIMRTIVEHGVYRVILVDDERVARVRAVVGRTSTACRYSGRRDGGRSHSLRGAPTRREDARH